MSDKHLNTLLPDFGDYSLDSLLDDYGTRTPSKAQSAPQSAEKIAERSRKRAMETLGQTLLQYQQSTDIHRPSPQPQETDVPAATAVSADTEAQKKARRQTAFTILNTPDEPLDIPAHPHKKEPPASAAAPAPAEAKAEVETPPAPVEDNAPPAPAEDTPSPAPTPQPESAPEKPRPKVIVGEDGIITLRYEVPGQKSDAEPMPESEPTQPNAEQTPLPEETAAPETAYTDEKSASRPPRPRRPQPTAAPEEKAARRAAAIDRLLTPIVQLLATKLAKRQMQKTEADNWPEPVEVRQTPELPPRKAGKFYASQIKPLRFRIRIALFLCIILAWISFQLPMAGKLGQSPAPQAGLSLILTLAVMLTALDVFTAGLRQLLELRPGAEALSSLACIVSCVDAAMVMFGYSTELPYCSIGAVSLTAALWAEKLTCTAMRNTLKTVISSKSATALNLDTAEDSGRHTLVRTPLNKRGLVRRSEQPDICQTTYATAAPILLAAALLLAILASVGGQGGYFLHTLSALLSVTASFAAFFAFPLPFSIASRRLRDSGAALAGYAGCADIGKTRRIVLTDEDLFPPGTMKFSEINILEGAFVSNVVSCTASLLANSGSGVTGLFNELMTRRGYEMVAVEQFKCHEGGGLSGMVGGERILVGSAGFMNLMGIRLPQNLNPKNAICTAIEGELVGVFTVEYIPTTSVQDALVTLLRGKTQAIFALRDFNITPLMIRQLFRMPTDNFNFPPFRDRYRMATAAQKDAPLSAIITRSGMLPLVDAAESGRKLYNTARLNTILSLVGTAVGLFIMFLLCRAGAFDTANVGNVLSFMLLWALPALILSFEQNR